MGGWLWRGIRALASLVGALVLMAGVAYLWLRYVPPPSLPQSKLLAPVAQVQATPGRGMITVSWSEIPNAVAYQVERSDRADGTFTLVSSAYGASPIFIHNLLERAFPGEPFGRLARPIGDSPGAGTSRIDAAPPLGHIAPDFAALGA